MTSVRLQLPRLCPRGTAASRRRQPPTARYWTPGDLVPGVLNTIDLAVTAGDATTFYKIVITRGAAAADATLSACRWVDTVTLVARVLQAHL